MVKSEKLYSPQAYLELVTGKCYAVDGDDDIAFIEQILKQNKKKLYGYGLLQTDVVSYNDLDVVLVDCMVYNKSMYEYEHILRWFEVPEDFEGEA